MHIGLNITEYFAIFFFVSIAVELILSRMKLIRARYNKWDTLASIGMTTGNVVTNMLISGVVVITGLTIASQFRICTISSTALWAWVAIFFLDDFAYYWFHRLSHERRLWWASHVNHHSSTHYNLSTAVRQTWTGGITGTWLPWIPLALLGFPPQMILAQQSFSLFYQFWIHTEAIHRMPRWFEYIFNTPSHHRVHHASNPGYLDRNYAGTLIIWDRMFGTFVEERNDEPVRYGIVHNINTYNPLRIAFHEWAAIGRDLVSAHSLREALGVVFGPPGWKQAETSDHIRRAWRDEQSRATSASA